MAKIDEIKEILNTLRVGLSLLVGLIVLIVGSLINRYDNAKIDMIFLLGVGSTLFLIGVLIAIINKISKKTKEIKDL